ncbi:MULTISPECIES: class I SAM-dependent methyltransferase [unclassified Kaistella]|uniref:class I SAM-dependent methyltransferase n=1 Tax=unclassified Kaistella TaxID=2762626 RepID=UPI0027376678|nr:MULTISPECIES: class I SAM-dependent methyltransferase [unclassified Kaistella]MDP2454552.1 class I SAM-dependent methyltransferase [Kaistella sp. SH11-4b]MDP2457290.1 class I SAM-dependent methyltransferase [Kaistella sp. SH40-3]MDP2460050.1 class I SAM-dependent methyltransferase [Kaistella sp. SH19-2b]
MKNILNKEIQQYINANLTTDLHSLLLKKSPFPEISMQEIVQQIKGKKVAQKKFSYLLKDGIIFPPNLNLEQASSQATAEFKAKSLSGKSFIDLTSGFGIDPYFLSQNFEEVTLVEQNAELLAIVKHNWKTLNKKANFINENLENFLKQNDEKFDLIYLDPARRDEHKNKKFLLEDLSPNLLKIQDQLLKISDQIIIKLSPLIDISYLISTLKNIVEIQIIAVRNEVKELLVFIYSNKLKDQIAITCINLESEEKQFSFNFDEVKSAVSEFSEALQYLYIPNNAVLKSGGFNCISEKFNLKKLHPNSHFYTSEELLENFPGRVLKVEIIDSKQIKKGEKYNIISKNHPLTPDAIKKKYKIMDGGNAYLIFTQTQKSKIILRTV